MRVRVLAEWVAISLFSLACAFGQERPKITSISHLSVYTSDAVKAEYFYVDLGSTSNTVNTTVVTTNVTEHIFRTGLNYHFNTPVVAKY